MNVVFTGAVRSVAIPWYDQSLRALQAEAGRPGRRPTRNCASRQKELPVPGPIAVPVKSTVTT